MGHKRVEGSKKEGEFRYKGEERHRDEEGQREGDKGEKEGR